MLNEQKVLFIRRVTSLTEASSLDKAPEPKIRCHFCERGILLYDIAIT
jgi:hypothetical protein